jgi:peptide/nickel transport system substrate-binding protein
MSGPKTGGHLKWANQASIGSLDATRNSSFVTAVLVSHWYDHPFTWDQELIGTEQMIDTWSMNPAATEYTFTLRDGLVFSGNFRAAAPVTTDDLLASIERWRTQIGTPSTVWDLSKPTLEKVDAKTFKIKPTAPFGLWVDYWAQSVTYVIPKVVLDALGDEETLTDYTGSGPFEFVSWDPGAAAVVQRHEAYKPRSEPKNGKAGARLALLDSFEVLEVPDAATKVAALQTGQIDFSEGLPNDFYETVLGQENLKVELISPWAIPNLASNKLWPPLNDPRSRVALLLMTDPAEYLAAGYGNPDLWQVCGAIYFCGSAWATDIASENYFTVDKARAQILWDEAVEATGFDGKMVLLTNTDYSDFYAAALITKRILEDLGAEVDFVVTDWATVISRKIANLDKPPDQGGWHFYHSWGAYMDPISDARIGKTWNGGWGNERGYKLIEDFSNAKSREEAQAIVAEIQTIYYTEDPPNINYGSFSFLIAMQNDVMGYIPHRNISIESVWLDR